MGKRQEDCEKGKKSLKDADNKLNAYKGAKNADLP